MLGYKGKGEESVPDPRCSQLSAEDSQVKTNKQKGRVCPMIVWSNLEIQGTESPKQPAVGCKTRESANRSRKKLLRDFGARTPSQRKCQA